VLKIVSDLFEKSTPADRLSVVETAASRKANKEQFEMHVIELAA
jgi:hypothetical protein